MHIMTSFNTPSVSCPGRNFLNLPPKEEETARSGFPPKNELCDQEASDTVIICEASHAKAKSSKLKSQT